MATKKSKEPQKRVYAHVVLKAYKNLKAEPIHQGWLELKTRDGKLGLYCCALSAVFFAKNKDVVEAIKSLRKIEVKLMKKIGTYGIWDLELSLQNTINKWAVHEYGNQYVEGFVDGFEGNFRTDFLAYDGIPKRLSDEYLWGISDGQHVMSEIITKIGAPRA